MKVQLTKVFRKDKISAGGKAYVSLGIKCNEYGDKWISGFGNKDNANWTEGNSVDVIIERKGEYLNFTMPKAEDKVIALEAKIDAIHDILKQVVAYITKNDPLVVAAKKDEMPDYPEDPIPSEEIPL